MSSRPISYSSIREGSVTIDLRVVCWTDVEDIRRAELALDRSVAAVKAHLDQRRTQAEARDREVQDRINRLAASL